MSIFAKDVSNQVVIARGQTRGKTLERWFQAVWRVLAASAVAASHTGTTAETTLATISVPGGAMGANGVIKVTTLWSLTNDASTKTLRVDFGGTDFLGVTPATNIVQYQGLTLIRNRNATNSQVGAQANFAGIGSSTGAVRTAAVDTTANVNLTITAELADSADTVTLEAYLVEIFYQA